MNDCYKIYKNNGVKLNGTSIVFNKNSYLVEINNQIIGYFNVNCFDDAISFDYELLEEFQNNGLGNKFFQMIEHWIVENFSFQKILLLVKYDNEKSKSIVSKNDYNIDYNELEKMEMYGEMTMYFPFVKEKAKVKKLV